MRWSAPTGPLHDPVADLRALHRLQLGTLFGLVGSLLGVLFDLTYRYGNLLTVSTGSSGPTFHSPGPSGDAYVLGYLAAGTVLEVVGLLLLRSTFGALTPNAPQFLWPERFTLLTFVGLAVIVAGFGLLLASLARAVACAGSGNPIPASCLLTAEFGGSLALLVAGAVLAVVCAVGILIGIWRVGTWFDNPILQVGAVLLLIPVAGTVVLLIASRREIERRSAARAAAG